MADRIKVEVDDSLESLIPGYLGDIEKWIADILGLAKAGDFEAIRDLTHKMAGTGAGYGFDFITHAGGEANKAAHEKSPGPCQGMDGEAQGVPGPAGDHLRG